MKKQGQPDLVIRMLFWVSRNKRERQFVINPVFFNLKPGAYCLPYRGLGRISATSQLMPGRRCSTNTTMPSYPGIPISVWCKERDALSALMLLKVRNRGAKLAEVRQDQIVA